MNERNFYNVSNNDMIYKQPGLFWHAQLVVGHSLFCSMQII